MKLNQVLQKHQSIKLKNGLKNALGDSYLIQNNPVCAEVRALALRLDYKFIPAWPLYQKASLYELPTILKKKAIPYNEIVPTLEYLSKKLKVNDLIDDVPVNLVSNHFHESAHCIADHQFKNVPLRNKKEKILFALLCESYANAVESMAITFVDNPVHQFFIEQNSYIYVNAKRINQRQQALKKWKAAGLFRLLWLSYLYSNFLVEDMPKSELESSFRFALGKDQLKASDSQLGLALFMDAYELNKDFRLKTARLYLGQLGFSKDVKKNLKFDFVYTFLSQKAFLNGFNQLSEQTAGRRN